MLGGLVVRLWWVLWTLGAVAVVARLAVGLSRVRLLVRRTTVVTEPEWTRRLGRVSHRLGLTRPVSLRMGAAGAVPVTCGILHPIVILPADAESWDDERRTLVLTHELAHVRRCDVLTHLVGQLAVAAFWFHPLAWLAAARMRLECERACDDLVLTAGVRPSRYAGDLLALVQTLRGSSAPAVAALAMARQTDIETRLVAILDGAVRRGPMGPRWIAAAMSVAAVAVATLAVVHPVSATPIPASASRGAIMLLPVVTLPAVRVVPPDAGDVPRDVALADAAFAAAALPSDAAKRSVLLNIAPRYCGRDVLRRAFFTATGTIASDTERRRVLLGVLGKGGRDAATVVAILHSVGAMSSDDDKALVLRTVAGVDLLADPAVRREFFAATNTVASSGTRAAILLAVIGELHARSAGPDAGAIALARATVAAACKLASISDMARVRRAVALGGWSTTTGVQTSAMQ
jgi:beta-lactamase regulating signal transducer with metallopeptidase domain